MGSTEGTLTKGNPLRRISGLFFDSLKKDRSPTPTPYPSALGNEEKEYACWFYEGIQTRNRAREGGVERISESCGPGNALHHRVSSALPLFFFPSSLSLTWGSCVNVAYFAGLTW